MTNKDASYHRAAIQYNDSLAVFAADLAEKLEHVEIQKWCRSVSKQHKFHAGRHKKALDKMENTMDNPSDAPDSTENNPSTNDPETPAQPDNPTDTPPPVDPAPQADPVESTPDPEQAAEPVESGVETTPIDFPESGSEAAAQKHEVNA